MKNVKIVIGACAGDEGKGLATDYFASQEDKGIVVLTNGGSQRAHTVELEDGTRHVFHHFGSGTLRGWDTYLSEHFILNPMQFCREYKLLKSKTKHDFKVYCSTECKWSTPYDMIYNQIMQSLNQRIDTCGMGIWTTIQRYKWFKDNNKRIINLYEMQSPYTTIIERANYLRDVRDYYLKLYDQNVTGTVDSKTLGLKILLYDNGLLSHFMADIREMISICKFQYPLFLYDNVIFENGQGLLIDMDVDVEYGTPSKTGLSIPAKMIREYMDKSWSSHSTAVENIETCYVTRSYVTRHGFGILNDEVNKESINNYMNDFTNVENQFQGSLRFGLLYPSILEKRIIDDYWKSLSLLVHISSPHNLLSLMVTHLNEHEFNAVPGLKKNFDNIYLSDTKFSDDIKLYNRIKESHE